MSRKTIREKTSKNERPNGYTEWLSKNGLHSEPVEANPDVLEAPEHTPTDRETAVRYILDHPAKQLDIFSTLEQAVFYAYGVDGMSIREMSKKLGRTKAACEVAIKGVQRAILSVARQVSLGKIV